jgi:intraflagellar transport protein 74
MLQRRAVSGTSTASPGVGIGLNAQVNVVDRQIMRQGLGGLRSAGKTGRGPNRQVQDKSYFMGLLRTKVGESKEKTTFPRSSRCT